jgi:hypothetical protein
MSCQVVLNTRSNFHDFTLSPFPITTGGEWLDKTDLSPAWRIAGYGAIVGYAEQLPYGVLVLNDQRDSAFDAPESALEQARAAAGEKDVSVGGGASVVQQYLSAGLLDEVLISVVPVLLGGGARLFDNLGDPLPTLRQVEAIDAPGVTHIRYARVEGA